MLHNSYVPFILSYVNQVLCIQQIQLCVGAWETFRGKTGWGQEIFGCHPLCRCVKSDLTQTQKQTPAPIKERKMDRLYPLPEHLCVTAHPEREAMKMFIKRLGSRRAEHHYQHFYCWIGQKITSLASIAALGDSIKMLLRQKLSLAQFELPPGGESQSCRGTCRWLGPDSHGNLVWRSSHSLQVLWWTWGRDIVQVIESLRRWWLNDLSLDERVEVIDCSGLVLSGVYFFM